MIDIVSRKPMRVEVTKTDTSSIRLPDSQLEEVQRILDSHGIRYWVNDQKISMDGGPFIAYIHFYRGTDAKAVQAILDNVQ